MTKKTKKSELPARCGYVAIVGRPNVGKSTLLNALVGDRISITSRKPQTTRHQIAGIRTAGAVQVICLDTPGLHKNQKKNALNRYMNRLAETVLPDANVILFVVDAQRWHAEDERILEKMPEKVPVILVLNKLDSLPDKKQVLPVIATLQEKQAFAHIVPLSARGGDNLATLEKLLFDMMPEGPHLFPDDQLTDKNDWFRMSEIIREQIILGTGQELPHVTAVVIESVRNTGEKVDVSAVIWVEREGQKPIVIGKKGVRLKKMGTQARIGIEKMLGKKVFLRLWVRVRDNWTDDERAMGSLGYR